MDELYSIYLPSHLGERTDANQDWGFTKSTPFIFKSERQTEKLKNHCHIELT